MFSAIESMFVMLAITILRATIKNPQSVAKEGAVISNLAMVATEADTSVNGTVWTSTPAPTVAAVPVAAAATVADPNPLTGK